MKSLLSVPVQLAEPHALPFRIIFEEHRRRNSPVLLAACSLLEPIPGLAADQLLAAAILRQEAAYATLARTNQMISDGDYHGPPLDGLLEICRETDEPLKQILHIMNASALCLSGGGIRSASFSLGVIEALSRFSRPSKTDTDHSRNLMDGLDYLSTVSGGGYTGSWLMSWIYRRMAAARPFPLIAESFSFAEEKVRIALAVCRQEEEQIAACVSINAENSALYKEPLMKGIKILAWACDEACESINFAKEDAASVVAKETAASMGTTSITYKIMQDTIDTASKTMSGISSELSFITLASFEQEHAFATMLAFISDKSARLETVLEALKQARHADWKTAYSDVITALAGDDAVTAGDPEPQPVRHLRSYTSFLAPALGFTLDTFDLAAIVFRNLVINWTMLIPLLMALVASFETSASSLAAAHSWIAHNGGPRLALTILLLFLLAACVAAYSLPSHHQPKFSQAIRPYSIQIFIGAVLLGCWLLVASWSAHHQIVHWSDMIHPRVLNFARRHIHSTYRLALGSAPIAFAGYSAVSISIFLSYKSRIASRLYGKSMRLARAGIMAFIATVVISTLTSSLLAILQKIVFPFLITASGAAHPHPHWLVPFATGDRLYIVFALPLLISVILVATSLLCALLGLFEMEEDREWWSRGGGCFLMINLVWIVSHGIALYGQGAGKRLIAGAIGLAMGGLGSAIGFSGATAAGAQPVKPSQLSSLGKFLQKHNLVLPTISSIAIALIVIGATAIEEKIRQTIPIIIDHPFRSNLRSALVIFAAFAVLSLLVNWAININLFSLHGMYRMRLMRAFLGASNFFRAPNLFTGFDPKDTPYEVDLPCATGAPLHVINCALNLVATKNTAWRQRKAECFTFTPLVSGSWRLGYVPSSIYGAPRGVTLATAMSISGAAFNPNMGYQSSKMLSLLMTFFNVRLGCWLPNPANPLDVKSVGFYSKSSPSLALFPLIAEAFGRTNDTSSWVELSDGGHFENLGLYEMVMRRCKTIIVVDAGADPHYQFEDLGNAIRKIRIDLGIPIDFDVKLPMETGSSKNNLYCAIGKIHYQCADPAVPGINPPSLTGTLIYIKATLTNEEPPDVFQYAKTHDTFPNEATANQFFNEAQFESYRHLGFHAVSTITKKVAPTDPRTIETFARTARIYSGQTEVTQPEVPPDQVVL
jgi:hypothetical protein